jgi:uncharacterized linocin/CFP29 family protein
MTKQIDYEQLVKVLEAMRVSLEELDKKLSIITDTLILIGKVKTGIEGVERLYE